MSASANRRLVVAVASCFYDPEERDADALLARYHAMTGWARAVLEAGADVVTVVQRFHRDVTIRRDGVEYRLVADGAPARAGGWFLGARFAGVVAGLVPDVVHVDGLIFPLLVRHLRWRLPGGTAIVVQDHGGVDPRSRIFRRGPARAGYRFGLGAANTFFFTAAEQARPWRDAGIIGTGQAVHEIPEASTDLAAGPQAPPLPGRPALLWVGRLDANKDPLTVLGGFELALTALPDAELTMVYGDDPLLPEVKAQIARAHLDGRVHLRGRLERSALPALYAGADLFLLGSHHEVACFSLIEALSFGVTPVVTDIPAFRAITAEMGARFPPGDVPAAARAIEQAAYRDPEERRRIVRAHFERELSWPAVGRRALALYRATAAARRTTS